MPRDSAAPPPPPQRPNQPKRNAALITLACTAAAGACLQLTQSSEGMVAKAKPDPVGILTGCYGERVDMSDLDPLKVYTPTECGQRLRKQLAQKYAPPIAECLPELVDRRRTPLFGALLDAGFNAGPAAICRSPMAARIHAGDLAGGCAELVRAGSVGPLKTHGWFTTARYQGKPMPAATMRAHGWTWAAGAWRKEFPGIVTRRGKEAKLCWEGL